MNVEKARDVAEWFERKHGNWIEDNSIVSWAEKLGIELNSDGDLDEGQLFHLFLLAVLWNNGPATYRAEVGERVFLNIKSEYTLSNVRKAQVDDAIRNRLADVAEKMAKREIFDLMMFIACGETNGESTWSIIREILNSPNVGVEDDDVNRLKQLYFVFNPTNGIKAFPNDVYLTVKVFLIFREIRIQFSKLGKYQYHTSICCIPDSHVEEAALHPCLRLAVESEKIGKKKIEWLLFLSRKVAQSFAEEPKFFYDLPLFYAHKDKDSPIWVKR